MRQAEWQYIDLQAYADNGMLSLFICRSNTYALIDPADLKKQVKK
jgi:hypothetical protein